MPVDVLLVDDHKIMRDGLRAILSRTEEFRVVGEAETGTDGVLMARKHHPHVVILDIGLPGLNGVETAQEIQRYLPKCKVVILSMYDDENSVVGAVRAGARGFILKRASDNDLVEALRIVAAGGMYLSPQVSDRLMTRIQKGDLQARQANSVLEALSPRELQVLRMVAEGKTSKEIAVALDLSELTVRSYRKTMMKKLGVNNVAGLTQLALSTGITQLPPSKGGMSKNDSVNLRDSPWGPLSVADAHVHFFSHKFFSTLISQKPGLTLESAAAQLGWTMPPESPEDLASVWIEELDRHGVETAALISSVPGDEASVTAARRAHPDRFLGYAMVNPRAFHADRISETLAEVQVACLFPAMHCFSVHDECAAPVFQWAKAHHRAVFVHCGALSVAVRDKLGLPSMFDMRYSNPIELHGIARRYPEVPIIVPHFGAGYFREALMLADLCPNVYFDTSSSNQWVRYQYSWHDLRHVFRHALDIVGPHRLLFGTDSSYFPRGWHAKIFEEQSRALYEIGVSAEDAQLIFGKNLLRITGSPPNII